MPRKEQSGPPRNALGGRPVSDEAVGAHDAAVGGVMTALPKDQLGPRQSGVQSPG